MVTLPARAQRAFTRRALTALALLSRRLMILKPPR